MQRRERSRSRERQDLDRRRGGDTRGGIGSGGGGAGGGERDSLRQQHTLPGHHPPPPSTATTSQPSAPQWGHPAPPPPPPTHTGPVERANFGLSGALSRDATTGNAVEGTVLKWSQPPEARLPSDKWRLYVFKGESPDPLETLHIHRKSAFLFGRDATVADVPLEHASISKQHAVIQYRLVEVPREAGDMGPPTRTVKPYLLDLDSANGTLLNGRRVEGARYIELKPKDVIRFGGSTREYVVVKE